MGVSHIKFNPRHKLRGAVGAHGVSTRTPNALNDFLDVLFVQQLLNRRLHHLPQFHSIPEDGSCGPKTIGAITEFQRRFVTRIRPDGRVDPGGATIAVLKGGILSPVKHTESVRAHSTLGSTVAAPKPTPAAPPAPVKESASVKLNYPPHVTAFLQANAAGGKAAAARWKVPASVLLAQAAHESGWGRRVKSNAYFGIKGKSPTGQSTSFKTHEVIGGKSVSITDSFRAYKDFAEAADDYGRFLNQNKRYRACFNYSNDPMKFVETLAAAGYATDPEYANKIKNTIRKYGLTDYDQ